uniref:pH-response regulator protein palC n=1 Tax=Blastobotrys adeninivorans TaxID=409370 RepID=A0A060T5E5_BLAAD
MIATFPFALPTTGAISLTSSFSSERNHQLLVNADATRSRVRDSLKRAKRADDPNVLEVIKALDDYLPLLFTIISEVEDGEVIEYQTEFAPSWRLPLKTSRFQAHLIEPPKVELASIEYERGMAILTYALACCVHSNAVLKSSSAETRWKQTTAALTQAAAMLRYLENNPCRIENGPMDLQPSTINGLLSMVHGSLHLIILFKTVEEDSKTSPSLMSRVAIFAVEKFRTASNQLVSSPVNTWLQGAQAYCVASAHRFMAIDSANSGKVGLAIGHLKAATMALGSLKGKKHKISSLLPKDKDVEGLSEGATKLSRTIEEQLHSYQAENKRLAFQAVPEPNSPQLSQNIWPSGREVTALPKPWSPPSSVIHNSIF